MVPLVIPLFESWIRASEALSRFSPAFNTLL